MFCFHISAIPPSKGFFNSFYVKVYHSILDDHFVFMCSVVICEIISWSRINAKSIFRCNDFIELSILQPKLPKSYSDAITGDNLETSTKLDELKLEELKEPELKVQTDLELDSAKDSKIEPPQLEAVEPIKLDDSHLV
ncbi:hypothetical protein RIF29_15064 [Crotalaria pallida]|uniref:Uncharacterized protein n=1 Tax=Crotalaria pallida TaxID=3830 RepID=A0AAN9FEC2_CROPI